jgi:hypothetical protein
MGRLGKKSSAIGIFLRDGGKGGEEEEEEDEEEEEEVT